MDQELRASLINDMKEHREEANFKATTTHIVNEDGRIFMDSKVVTSAMTEAAMKMTFTALTHEPGSEQAKQNAYGALATIENIEALEKVVGILRDTHTTDKMVENL